MKYTLFASFIALAVAMPVGAQVVEDTSEIEDPIGVLLEVFPELSSAAEISDGSKGEIQKLYLERGSNLTLEGVNFDDLMSEARAREAEFGIDRLASLLGLDSDIKETVEVDVDRVDLEEVATPSFDEALPTGAEPMIDFSALSDDFLADWTLIRAGGRFYVQRFEDPLTRVEVFPGVILGEYGRVREIVDFGDELYLELQTGERISGS